MLEVRSAAVAVLPSGSAMLASLVESHLRPLARQRLGAGQSTVLRTLHTTGLTPADVAAKIGVWPAVT